MSMHLLPAYWTTTNTKSRKQKRSKKQQATDASHAKFLKKMGYTGEKRNPVRRSVAQPGSASALGAEGRKFESSHSDQFYHPGSARKEPNVYSGKRKLLGIATMHKSNMVPVFSEDDAEAIAKMRR